MGIFSERCLSLIIGATGVYFARRKEGERRITAKMARKSFFHYFDKVDRDDSGLIEQNEVEYLARLLFGEGRDEEIKAYVKGVFDKFDDNHSGALSFKESREFIEGLIDFFDQEGQISNTELSDILKSVNAQEMDNNSSESDTIEVIESNDPVLAPVENVPSSPEMIDVDDVPESVAIKTPQEPVEVPVADKVIPAVETAEPVAPVASEEKPVADEAVAATDDATDNTEESVSNVVESADNDKLAPGTAAVADSVTAEEPTGNKTEVTTVDTTPAEVEVVADIATDIDEQGAVKPAEAVDVTDQVKPIETAADSDTKAIVVDEPVSQEASADIVVS